MARLCFDYGHGGSDPGACYNGRKESVDVLYIGREVPYIYSLIFAQDMVIIRTGVLQTIEYMY